MNFNKRANGPRMRLSEELQKTKSDMKVLKENYNKLQRKYRSMICSIQRMKQKKCKSPSTSRSKAKKQLEGIDVTEEFKKKT